MSRFAILVFAPRWLYDLARSGGTGTVAGMRVIYRVLLLSLLVCGPAILAGRAKASADRDTPVRGGKTVKECNEELSHNTAALEAAGESASAFFHACWFQSEKGKPTPIVAKEQGASQPDEHPAPRSAEAAGSAVRRAEAVDGERHAARRRTARHATRRVGGRAFAARRRGRDDEVPGIDDAATAFPAVRTEADRSPGHVNVGVPLVGTVAVPILPGLGPTVQSVVEHPVVPGLLTTSP